MEQSTLVDGIRLPRAQSARAAIDRLEPGLLLHGHLDVVPVEEVDHWIDLDAEPRGRMLRRGES